ncbi:MAG: hypothetical protein OJF51_001092 [Nitrospira sp.]|nr:MAG: hypothetical protein OJF51_001092 [Nitrospira sp.]
MIRCSPVRLRFGMKGGYTILISGQVGRFRAFPVTDMSRSSTERGTFTRMPRALSATLACGKAKKLVATACMRNLFIIFNAMLNSGTP